MLRVVTRKALAWTIVFDLFDENGIKIAALNHEKGIFMDAEDRPIGKVSAHYPSTETLRQGVLTFFGGNQIVMASAHHKGSTILVEYKQVPIDARYRRLIFAEVMISSLNGPWGKQNAELIPLQWNL